MIIFQGSTMVWFYELHHREKIRSSWCAIHRNELYTGILNSAYLLSGTCHQKKSVECRMALTKVFLSQISLHFRQFYFYSRQVCNKRLANWTAITVTDTLTFNGFTTGMLSMVWTLGNGQIRLGIPPVVLQFILVFFHFVVCNCLFAKQTFSFWHWEKDRMGLAIRVFEKF